MKTQIAHDTALVRSLGLALATLLFSACATHAPMRGSDAAAAVAFPDTAKASPRGGLFVNLDNLRQYARGMSKRQLYGLLGTPHFNEGMWGVREWNYLFNFRSQPNGDYFSCQFQVHFDRNGIAQESYWKPQSCAAMLQAGNAAPAASTAQPLPAQPLALQADALFGFDSDSLTAQGRRSVDALVQRVRAASQVQMIAVTGYTDRIGADDYNHKLSQRRAEAVRAALIAGGVPSTAIVAEGRGETAPVVACAQPPGDALIDCLAPNRRVEISGIAQLARK
ncbi:OmpA family protein [Stenotrophomonas oahuensis]|uniref:OmpA family protein n=1 Tax=Stenotrophomonas oahuensis TaxID=3003271 RepID=A0ABY9YN73_9GAMM|nr:OmpA family protein [Stenotrophomonas sp. A5586]WNH52346.1 OmpA family protein [Stenotrophomonas sp. A5586]